MVQECCLFPLSSALSTAAYYDHALDCAKLAGQIETSRELVYLKAFLYLALGETEQACKLYKHAASGLGSIRLEELEQIRVYVHQHISEEDILEVYEELAYHCKKNANLLNLR